MKKTLAAGAALLLLGTGLIGCSKTEEGVKEDASKDTTAVGKAADKTADTTKGAAKNASAATSLTPKVKNAIIADKMLNNPSNLINVDSKNNVVHLKGHVMNAQMKKHAGDVAQKALTNSNATDKLSNELTVSGH